MEINVYVANLAKYNAGELVGDWITLPTEEEELSAFINGILGNDEEYAIHDHESFFPIPEYTNIFALNQKLLKLQSHDQTFVESLYEHIGNLDEVIHVIENGDYSCYYDVNSLEDVAYEMVQEGLYGNIPEEIKSFIDYGKIARDLDCLGWTVYNRIGIYVY